MIESRSVSLCSACCTRLSFPAARASSRAITRNWRACLARAGSLSSVAYFSASSAFRINSKISLASTGRRSSERLVVDVQVLERRRHLAEGPLELHQLHEVASDPELAAHVGGRAGQLVLGQGHRRVVVLRDRGVDLVGSVARAELGLAPLQLEPVPLLTLRGGDHLLHLGRLGTRRAPEGLARVEGFLDGLRPLFGEEF